MSDINYGQPDPSAFSDWKQYAGIAPTSNAAVPPSRGMSVDEIKARTSGAANDVEQGNLFNAAKTLFLGVKPNQFPPPVVTPAPVAENTNSTVHSYTTNWNE